MGGPSRTFTDGLTLDCTIQTMGADEARKYEARGSKYLYNVFFSSDPTLTVNNRLKWTVRANVAFATDSEIYLRVLDCYPEGRPGAEGEDMLWVADCEQETTRKET